MAPVGEALKEAMAMARRIAQAPPLALRMMRRSITAVYNAQEFEKGQNDHLMLRMIESLVPDVPECEHLGRVRMEQGMRAFLEARDGPFRE